MSEVAVEIDEEAVETPEAAAETPEAPPEPYKPSFSEQDQAFIDDKIVGPKVAKQRQAERELETMRTELEDARSRIPQQTRPNIPDIPDAFDDGYEDKISARDDAIRTAAAYDAQQMAEANYRNQVAAQQAQDKQDAMTKTVTDYSGRAQKLGIAPSALQEAGARVAQEGLSDPVVSYILGLDQGPAVTMYLAKNPQTLSELSQMSPMDAAVRISGEIKAAAVMKGEAPPPAPTETVGGGGFQEKDGGPAGAVYE